MKPIFRLYMLVMMAWLSVFMAGCGGDAAPDSIANKSITLSFIVLGDRVEDTIVFDQETTTDPAGSDVPYTYTKTGINTALLVIHNNQVYQNLGDSSMQLTFTSASEGTFEAESGDFLDPVTGVVEKSVSFSGTFTLAAEVQQGLTDLW